MLDKNILLALNGAEDVFLEETAQILGYNTESQERIVPMTIYRKRRSGRFAAILTAACLLLSLGIVAYAADLFGIRALLIRDESLEHSRREDNEYLSITQPQDVPEEMSTAVKEKIENSTRAWAEWDSWRRENGPRLPENCIPPDNVSSADYEENPDGTWTVTFYEGIVDGERKIIETRTITAEEHEQELAFWEAASMGFSGYDFMYHVETQEMADKLEEIAGKYGLNVRHTPTQLFQNFGDQTEFLSREELTEKIGEICADGGDFFRSEPTGYDKFYYFDEGTFAVSFYTTDDFTNSGTRCYLYNSPYGTLSSGFEIVAEVEDAGALTPYIHTTPDGAEVTVLHNGADMYAYIYLENSFVTLSFHQREGLSPEEINSIIDMVNFSAIG